MPAHSIRTMPIEELRARVAEAEKLLRLAKQLAQYELLDPAKTEHAKDRIASICNEVHALFPGSAPSHSSSADQDLGGLDDGLYEDCDDDGEAPDDCEGDARGNDAAATSNIEGAEDDEGAAPEAEGEDEGRDEGESSEDGEDDEDEWTIDYGRLRVAIQDPVLMAQFPDEERAQFKAMAEELIDAYDRQQLYSRVTAGFLELHRTTRAGAEAMRRRLALTLTFEGLRAKYRA